MFPAGGPTAFIGAGFTALAVLLTLGLSILWAVFAITLGLTLAAAIHRSIPRKER
jgi:hypothetical protein